MPKISVYIKDTDVLHDAINEAVDDELKSMNLDEEEKDSIREIRREKYAEIASKWWEYGEYITVEFDTDTKEARVVPVNE